MAPEITGLLQVWHHTCASGDHSLILPDGCQDLIAWQASGGEPQWKISSLIDQACQTPSKGRLRYVGYRLQPGTRIQTQALLSAVAGLDLDDAQAVLERLDATISIDAHVVEALSALACEPSVRGAQRQLGLSERGLQRLLRQATGRAPSYWRRLARLRCAARALDGLKPLAAIAVDHGFSDQSHMNLEFNRWLGMTPASVMHDPGVLRLLNESGYG